MFEFIEHNSKILLTSQVMKIWNWKSNVAILRWEQHSDCLIPTGRNKNHRVIWLVYILYFGQNQQSTLALFYCCDYYWWFISINFAVNNNKTKTITDFDFLLGFSQAMLKRGAQQIARWFFSFSVFRRHFLIFHLEITRFGKCKST